MGERRMFSSKVILSDDFLDLPATSRCLYFTLNMFADDDGFLNNYKTIMRMCNAAQNDFDVLIGKQYLIDLGDGVIVIRHWKIHNLIRSDRYNPTAFDSKREMLMVNGSKEYEVFKYLPNEIVDETDEIAEEVPAPEHTNTNGTPDGYQRYPQVKLSKDKLSKDKLIENDADFERFWKAYPKKVGKAEAHKSFKKANISIDILLTAVEQQKNSAQWRKENGRFIPNPATWLNQGRWDDELEQESIYKRRDIAVEDLPEVRRPKG